MNRNKLELTWIGKENRPRLEPRILLEDPEKSYHASHRVTDHDLFDNRLIFGDNLLVLKALEQEFAGKIKSIYVDPPFNTQQAFEHYDDSLEHSIWLQLMRDRIEILYKLLSSTGSLFVHIDDNELGYLIALIDEIFGRRNRISVIAFKQSAASGPKSINPGLVTTSNFILYYAKDRNSWDPNRVYVPIPRDPRYNNYILNFEEPYEKWRIGTLRAAFANYNDVDVKDLDSKFGSKLEQKITEFVLENRHRVIQPALVRPEDINVEARGALTQSEKRKNVVTKSPREERYFLNGKQLLFYSAKVQVIDGNLSTAGGGFRYYRLAPSLLKKDKWGNWVISEKFNGAMLAEAVCKLEGFVYAPSDSVYWQQGHSTERDFIYVTTAHLSHDQLQQLSDEVGSDRSLLVVCSAFRGRKDGYGNLTVKKIPKAVLSRCEWGKDDYSLKVENLPKAPPPPGQMDLLSVEVD